MKKDELIALIKKNEDIYSGNKHDIKYLFIPEKESDKLLVIFSGFHGKEIKGNPPVYNYINTLEDIKENKLFVLDGVDNVPVYYLGTEGEDSYLKDTSELINIHMNKLNIDKSKLILTGSSKGGTAALSIGLHIQAGHIISAANQLYVGRYLDSMPNIRALMFNKIFGNNDDENVEKLNEVFMSKILVNKTKSNLYFHAGNRDPHYINHMKPMLRHFENKKINYELDLRNYVGHNSVVYYFPEYLKRKILEILETPKIINYSLVPDLNSVIIRPQLNSNRPKILSTSVEVILKNKNKIVTKFQNVLNHKISVNIQEVEKVKIYLKEYDRMIDTKIFEVKENNPDIDYFSAEYLIYDEWIGVKGRVANNSNMVRTARLKYNPSSNLYISGSGYVSFYSDDKFITTKRYMGSKMDLPFELNSIQDANYIIISYNKRWLDTMQLLEK